MTADSFRRGHIASADRDYSRGKWTPGGSFADASNISRGGNTVFIVKPAGTSPRYRSVALGKCDPADGYTGALTDPPGPPVPETDQGCGFDYSGIMWETPQVDQQNVLLNARHPFGESAEIGVVANFSQSDTNERYAPSVGTFRFEPDSELLAAINQKLDPDADADNDLFYASHRFVGHGNRHWRTKSDAYDVTAGIKGRLNSWLGYDAELNLARRDTTVRGDTFVHEDKIADEILNLQDRENNDSYYDLEKSFFHRTEAPAGHTEHQPAPRNRRPRRIPWPSRGTGGIGLFHRRAKGGMDRRCRDEPGGSA